LPWSLVTLRSSSTNWLHWPSVRGELTPGGRAAAGVGYDDTVDLRQLRLFCRIVDRRSFSLAAEELQITQPAASQQVRSLERGLQTVLLDRSRRTVTPTDAGYVLYRYAREILDLQERAQTEIRDLADLLSGSLVLGASMGPGEHLLPAMLTKFKAEHPGVSISLHVDDTQAVVERVLAREFELGAVGAVTSRSELVAEPLARDEIVLVCAASHPWATRPTVALKEVVEEPQIVQQPGSGVRSVVEAYVRARGMRPEEMNVVMEMGLMESAKKAAMAGGGVTFVSRSAIGSEIEHGSLAVVPIEGVHILRDFATIRSRTKVLSRAAEALLTFFREQYTEADVASR
jgi:DNA-binding transcriptional LysR family regulator